MREALGPSSADTSVAAFASVTDPERCRRFKRSVTSGRRLRSGAGRQLSPLLPVRQDSEATLRFKIYFASVSFGGLTLMCICGGMLGAGAWSKGNTAGVSAL